MWSHGSYLMMDGRSNSTVSYHSVFHEIHVLLVDHDADCLLSTAKILEFCSYRVTAVDVASTALAMLVNGKVQYDLIMANINSPDLQGFKLLQTAVKMDIPVILMSFDEDNAFMSMRALEHGAILFIKKPTTIEAVKCFWQLVLREKSQKIKEKQRINGEMAATTANFMKINAFGGQEVHHQINLNTFANNTNVNMFEMKKDERFDRNEEWDSSHHRHIFNNGKVKRKVCTEWTEELHAKFMDAVTQLGEGRCFPKEILEIMNVPGLTRMQVASHLQKCRNNNWRAPEERKTQNQTNNDVPSASETAESSHPKARRFGSMPRLGRSPNSVRPQNDQETDQQGSEIRSSDEKMAIMPIMRASSHHQHRESYVHFGDLQQPYGYNYTEQTSGAPSADTTSSETTSNNESDD